MRLSEAMRLGAMMKPQCTGRLFTTDGRSCALGAAAEAMGIAPTYTNHVGDRIPVIEEGRWPVEWQALLSKTVTHPSVCPSAGMSADYIIQCLNDGRHWTREQIADWVETLEAQQAVAAVDPVEGIAELTPDHARIGI